MTVYINNDELVGLVRQGLTNDQIAAHFECSTRTLERRRKAIPELNVAVKEARAEHFEQVRSPHGTYVRYSHGCRCGPCRAASTTYHRERRHQRALAPVPKHVPHGSPSTYHNWSCRCRPCTDAWVVYTRPYIRARAERKRAAREAS